ncbi:Gamma-aminobutyraldehyde dehydrogenase [Cedecea neteri]|uniref:Gamma-aminobutyraldehyde dehydrogenase n=1 Tax=Cedecea neteri TaxID=158822 RepID=A0A2X3IXK4_9ENTR|nr:Gamma-aminobutyraldehyde dehydrogenase [Cedecea neteri]
MQTLKHFINGQYVAGQPATLFDLVSPVNGEVYAQSPDGGAEEVNQAYAAAKAAFAVWKHSLPSERQRALLKLADEIERNAARIVEVQSQETGQLKHFIERDEIAASCDAIRFFAGAARCLEGKASGEYAAGFTSTIRREPLGIVGQVTPWNYPFMMAVWKIAPALAAGNTVVLKPSDTTPIQHPDTRRNRRAFIPAGRIQRGAGQGQYRLAGGVQSGGFTGIDYRLRSRRAAGCRLRCRQPDQSAP